MENTLRVTGRTAFLMVALLVLALLVAACAPIGQAPGGATGGTTGAASTAAPAAEATVAEETEAPSGDETAAVTATEMPSASSTITSTTAVTGTTNAGGEAGIAQVAVSENDQLGQFLVDSAGMTLYLFTNDTPGTSNCYGQCETNWPPLFGTSATVTGDDVDQALVGTTTRTDGRMQITYNGWPLYYFAADQNPGDVNGQGVGGVWFVVSPAGEQVE